MASNFPLLSVSFGLPQSKVMRMVPKIGVVPIVASIDDDDHFIEVVVAFFMHWKLLIGN